MRCFLLFCCCFGFFHNLSAQTDSSGWLIKTVRGEKYIGFIIKESEDSLIFKSKQGILNFAWKELNWMKLRSVNPKTLEEIVPRNTVAEHFGTLGSNAFGLQKSDKYLRTILFAGLEFGIAPTDHISFAVEANPLFGAVKTRMQTRFLTDKLYLGGGVMVGRSIGNEGEENQFNFLGTFGKLTFGDLEQNISIGTGVFSNFSDQQIRYQNISLFGRFSSRVAIVGDIYRLKLGERFDNFNALLLLGGVRKQWQRTALGVGVFTFLREQNATSGLNGFAPWLDFSIWIGKS